MTGPLEPTPARVGDGPGRAGAEAARATDPLAAPGGDGALTAAEFIRARTQLAAPPLIPEIVLRLSRDEPTGLWEQTERETGRDDLPPPFWAYPWAGGIGLARYLLDHRDQVAGRVVLDLASGSGLVAIAAALAGAARVAASDIDPMAAAAIGLNAAANSVRVTVAAGDLLADASAADAALAGEAGQPPVDLVLVGDACYERRMAHRMLAFLDRARAAGARALVGDPGRAYLPDSGLRAVASYAVPVWAGLEDQDVKQTTVWERA
jgi:predicted nicotinamide N-methyase